MDFAKIDVRLLQHFYVSSVGFGAEGLLGGPCFVNTSAESSLALVLTNGTIFSTTTDLGTQDQAGYICEKESKYQNLH